MTNRILKRAATLICSAAVGLSLGACVTNEELGNPAGWEEVRPAAEPALQKLLPDAVRQRGVLTAGSNTPYAPNEFKDSQGRIIGFEIDLIKAAGAKLGLKVESRQMDFNLILPAISAGSIDIGASAFTDTEERQEKYDFVDFFSAGIAWATQPGREQEITPDNACGLTVAVQKGTYSDTDEVQEKVEKCAAEGKPELKKLVYPTADAAATATILRRADAYSTDSSVAAFAVQRSQGKLVQIGEPFDTAPFGFGFKKGSPLAPAFGAAVQSMIDDGSYQKILSMWGVEDGALDKVTMNLKPFTPPGSKPPTQAARTVIRTRSRRGQ